MSFHTESESQSQPLTDMDIRIRLAAREREIRRRISSVYAMQWQPYGGYYGLDVEWKKSYAQEMQSLVQQAERSQLELISKLEEKTKKIQALFQQDQGTSERVLPEVSNGGEANNPAWGDLNQVSMDTEDHDPLVTHEGPAIEAHQEAEAPAQHQAVNNQEDDEQSDPSDMELLIDDLISHAPADVKAVIAQAESPEPHVEYDTSPIHHVFQGNDFGEY